MEDTFSRLKANPSRVEERRGGRRDEQHCGHDSPASGRLHNRCRGKAIPFSLREGERLKFEEKK